MSPLPDRIDFSILDNNHIIVQKMRREPAERRDVVTDHDIHLDLDLNAALDWCRQHGYTVRTWDGGARAWHGEIWVIRTRSQIKRKREQAEREVAAETAHLKGGEYLNEYIGTRRTVTHAVMVAAANACARHYGMGGVVVKGRDLNPYLTSTVQVGGEAFCDRVHRACWATSVYDITAEEAFARVFP